MSGDTELRSNLIRQSSCTDTFSVHVSIETAAGRIDIKPQG